MRARTIHCVNMLRRFSVMRSTRSSAAQRQKPRLLERRIDFVMALVETRALRRDRRIFRRRAGGRRIAELLAPRIDIGKTLLEAFGCRAQIVAHGFEAGARLRQARVGDAFAADRLLDLVERQTRRIEGRQRRRRSRRLVGPRRLRLRLLRQRRGGEKKHGRESDRGGARQCHEGRSNRHGAEGNSYQEPLR